MARAKRVAGSSDAASSANDHDRSDRLGSGDPAVDASSAGRVADPRGEVDPTYPDAIWIDGQPRQADNPALLVPFGHPLRAEYVAATRARSGSSPRAGSAAWVAQLVRDKTDDGRSLVGLLWDMARGVNAAGEPVRVSNRDKLAAIQMLLERGYGKTVDNLRTLPDALDTQPSAGFDFSALSDDELETLARIYSKGVRLPSSLPGEVLE